MKLNLNIKFTRKLRSMLMFTSVVSLWEDEPRAKEIYKCLLSSDWLGILIHRSKVRCFPPCHATRWSEVVGTSLNSSLLLLRINQIRISILFIYLLHLSIFFYLIWQWLQIYVIVPILIVKHSGYSRCKHLTSSEGRLNSQFKLWLCIINRYIQA